MPVEVVVVGDAIADMNALLVLEAKRNLLDRDYVNVGEGRRTLLVVTDDAIDDFVRYESADGKQHRYRRFLD